MRPSMLFATVLAGCLSVAAVAEARDRHGHHDRQMRSFAHHSFGFREHRSWNGRGHDRRWFGPPSGLRGFAPPPRHRQSFGHRHSGSRFSHRRNVLRFADRPSLPLSLQPGHRILAGRQILPFVSHRPLVRPVIVRPRHHFPSFVRVPPGPGFGFGHDRFGIPHRSGGLTIIVRDPW